MHQREFLLATLFGRLGARGLDPYTLEPWRAWVAFKGFARFVAEVPDPGVSVQISQPDPDEPVHLLFLRQVVELEEGYFEPTGGLVCELLVAPQGQFMPEVELWSFDYSSFEQFVDGVEQDPRFSDLAACSGLQSDVYWEEA
jgi:hypothetical protein